MFTKQNISELCLIKEYLIAKEDADDALREEFAAMPDFAPSEQQTDSWWAASRKRDECEQNLQSEKYAGIDILMKKYKVKDIDDLTDNFSLIFLNTLKSFALGLDDLFKKTGNNQVKFHQVTAAIYQTIYSLMVANYEDKLRSLFGDLVDDQETMKLMQGLLKDFVLGKEGILAADKDDRK